MVDAKYSISGMSCTSCVGTIENHLKSFPAVRRVMVSLVLGSATVRVDKSVLSCAQVQEEIEDIGFGAELLSAVEVCRQTTYEGAPDHPPDHPPTEMANLCFEVMEDTQGSTTTANKRALLGHAMDRCVAYTSNIPGILSTVRSRQGCCIRIQYNPRIARPRTLIRDLEIRCTCKVQVKPEARTASECNDAKNEYKNIRRRFWCSLLPTLIVFCLGLAAGHHRLPAALRVIIIPGVSLYGLLMFLFTLPVHCVCGRSFHVNAIKGLRHCSASMDTLVSFNTNVTFAYSTISLLISFGYAFAYGYNDTTEVPHFFSTAAVLVTVVLLGKMIEHKAKSKTLQDLDVLLRLKPDQTELLPSFDGGENYGALQPVKIPCELIELDDMLLITPGQLVPADGSKLNEGESCIDESLLTGESTTVSKGKGDVVLAGSSCVTGALIIRVEKVGNATALGQIIHLVQQAQAEKPPVQVLADKIAQRFVPGVLLLAVVTFVTWMVVVSTGMIDHKLIEPYLLSNFKLDAVDIARPTGVLPMGSDDVFTPASFDDFTREAPHNPEDHSYSVFCHIMFSLEFSMAVCALACPCALGLAVPTAVVVCIGQAARAGILIKHTNAIEEGAKTQVVILDKTGTVTSGISTVSSFCFLSSEMSQVQNRHSLFQLPVFLTRRSILSYASLVGRQSEDVGPRDPLCVSVNHNSIDSGTSSIAAPESPEQSSEAGLEFSLRSDSSPRKRIAGADPEQRHPRLPRRGSQNLRHECGMTVGDELNYRLHGTDLNDVQIVLLENHQRGRAGSGSVFEVVSDRGQAELESSGSKRELQVVLFWWLLNLVESQSTHPVAEAVKKFYQSSFIPRQAKSLSGKGNAVSEPLADVEQLVAFKNVVGEGVECSVQMSCGRKVVVTARRWRDDEVQSPKREALEEWVDAEEMQAHTVVSVLVDGTLVGGVSIKHDIHPQARKAVQYMQDELHQSVWLCTGDRNVAATTVGSQLGIPPGKVLSRAMPKDKVALIIQLQAPDDSELSRKSSLATCASGDDHSGSLELRPIAPGRTEPNSKSIEHFRLKLGTDGRLSGGLCLRRPWRFWSKREAPYSKISEDSQDNSSGFSSNKQGRRQVVCMVGDGVNDSPALAIANVGVAIGASADVTISAASVVLVGNNVSDLASFFKLCRLTVRTFKRNFFWASAFNGIGLPLAAGVCFPHIRVPPVAAAVAMAISSIAVVGSSLLMKRFQKVDKSW